METSQLSQPPILPKAPTSPVPVEETPVVEQARAPAVIKRNILTWILIGSVVLVIFVGSFLFGTFRNTSTVITPTATPTAMATSSAINRQFSQIATESAFVQFEADLDTLTKGIQSVQIQHQQLLPPKLDLPLGF